MRSALRAVRGVVLGLLAHFSAVSALSGSAILELQTRRGQPLLATSSESISLASTVSPLRLRGGKEQKSPVIFQLNEDPNAKKVEVCGSWDGWQSRLPLSKNGEGWKQAHFLPVGVHQYKFILDDSVWKCSNNLPQAPGPEGFMNNVVEVAEKKRGLVVNKEDLKSALNPNVRSARLQNLQARMERLQNRVDSFGSEEGSRGSSLSRRGEEEAARKTAGGKGGSSKASVSGVNDLEDAAEEDSNLQNRVHEIARMGRGPSIDDHTDVYCKNCDQRLVRCIHCSKWTPIDKNGNRLGSNKEGGLQKLVKRVLIAAVLAGAGFVAKTKFDEQQQAVAAQANQGKKKR